VKNKHNNFICQSSTSYQFCWVKLKCTELRR
jgi:hypothetical protein